MSVLCSTIKKYNTYFLGLCLFFSSVLPQTVPLNAQSLPKPGEKSSFKANLINIEAAANETFRFNTTLRNGTTQARIYRLEAGVPEGWMVTFRTMGSPVTSVRVEGGQSQEITVELNARPDSKPSTHTIPVTAVSSDDSLRLDLEAVLKGAYGIELTTPSGRLSDDVTEGSSKEIHLVVRNTATLPLENVELTAQTPSNWEATFEPSKIALLDPSKSADVKVTLKVPSKTVAGDYVTTFTAKNTNANANSTFRITVKTSLLSGWVGMLVIVLAIGLVYNLIRKYGRR